MTDTNTAEREAKLARIRALMAKTTENGCSEAEAQSAAAAVDRLLATYEISMDEASQRKQDIVQLRVKIEGHKVTLAALKVAAFCDCKAWLDHGDLMFLGFKVDTEIAEYLIQLFRRAMTREVGNFTVFNQDYELMNEAGQREMIASFNTGMAARLGDRLTELKGKRDFTQRKTGGFDLVAVKMPMVQAAYDALGLKLGRASSGRSVRHEGAYQAGQSAANGVSLNAGVAGRAASGGRLK